MNIRKIKDFPTKSYSNIVIVRKSFRSNVLVCSVIKNRMDITFVRPSAL